jgi:hypothetical protein
MSGLAHQENFKLFGYKIPLYFWFVLSGSLCDVLQAFIDYGVSLVYPFEFERATVCWTVSYAISICIRHSSHRFIVFGEYEGSYFASLCRTYATYSSSIVLSMVTNHLLVNQLFLTHKQAWIITMLWTGVYNYFMLKASWRTSSDTKTTVPSSSGESKNNTE